MTVFAHGLAGDIAGTRPLGSAVTGSRVFFSFRGHGGAAAPPGPWTFGDLATDLRTVADQSRATRAVGVSMGAAAVARLLSETPDRFERVVFYLPASLDGTRPAAAIDRLERFLSAHTAADLTAAVAAEIPPTLRDTSDARAYVRRRVDQLTRDGLAPQLATLWQEPAVADPTLLKSFSGRALVLGCQGDPVHPAAWAEDLAATLPNATLHIYDEPDVLWTNRTDLRTRISTFLNA